MCASHASRFTAVVKGGFNGYLHKYASHLGDHSKTSRASLIHDEMVQLGREVLPADEFRCIHWQGRDVFTFQDSIVIQLKRLDKQLKPSNVKTAASSALYEFGEAEGLEGIGESLPIVTLGYIPDELWSSPTAVYACHIVNNRAVWRQRLDDVDDGQQMLSVPTPSYVPSTRPTKARIKHPDVSEHGNVPEVRTDKSRHVGDGEAGSWAHAG